MSERILLEPTQPTTQSVDAVKQLVAYHHHSQASAEMPDFYRLSGEMVLLLSNKKDAYYVTTPKACSCPAAAYRPGQPCKHMREYFPQIKKTSEAAPERLFRTEESFRPVLPVSEVA